MSRFFLSKFLVLLVAASASGQAADSSTVEVTKKVFLDMTVGGQPAGRIVLGLFGNVAPKTVANFVSLATNEVSIHWSGSAFRLKHTARDFPS